MIRKTLACCCISISVVISVFLNSTAYMIIERKMDSKLAMLLFIPFFIIMYWMGTFFEQLLVKDKKLIFKKVIAKSLRAVYTICMISVCIVWLWVIYRYTYFFGDVIGKIRGFFS